MSDGVGEQLALVRAQSRAPARAKTRPAPEPAAVDPVAVVVVDVGLPHLDRPFEYLVPADLAETAVAGVRVRVRFAGQDVDGFVVERRAEPEHTGRLAPLRTVVSPEPVLTPLLLRLCREIADRYAGTLGDVLRLAIPPRHATAERNLAPAPDLTEAEQGSPPTGRADETAAAGNEHQGDGDAAWAPYPAGAPFLRRVADGQAPAASWIALPGRPAGQDWPEAFAAAAQAALDGGRGAVLVVPDHRDVDRVDRALRARLGPGRHVRLTADQGPQARYTAWLKVLRGHVHCVVGTRAAMFAPVRRLGLVAWWDDGDDLLAEPRAPYPHVREVLAARARLEGAALLSGGFARTTAVQQWFDTAQAHPVAAAPAVVRRCAPRVLIAGEGADVERDGPAARAHLPSLAWRTAKAALEHGPVLIQVPRRGYLPSLACQDCRSRVRCAHCHGPVALSSAHAEPACRWCGAVVRQFECASCQGRTLRSSTVGARRTAEELGRAFPGVPVHTSGSGEVLPTVAAAPSLVICTPGAEPVAEGGYAATLLLDAWAMLDRPGLDAAEEALRRWLGAAALTRGAAEGGVAVLCGVPTHTTLPAVEALVRWDPAWFAARELAERAELALPPTVRMARLVAGRKALETALEQAQLPGSVERLGPLPYHPSHPSRRATGEGQEALQLLLRTSLADAPALSASLTALRHVRSARKEAESVGVRIDPVDGLG